MPADSTIQRLASFAQNSKAHDDNFSGLNNRNSYILDVLKNDQGGQSKVLWSLDEGSGVWNEPADLLSRDDINSLNSSQFGAQVSITQDGKISYVITPELQSKLRDLAVGESLDDTFIYAMKPGQGDSPLNWAKATVTLNGLNHAPELTGTTAILANGTKNTDYKILASDLLQGFTDADNDSLSIINLTATHGLLTETADGWILTPEESYAGDIQLNYDVTDSHGGSVSTTLQFTLKPLHTDNRAPSMVSTEPFDDFDAFPVNNNLVLHFNEVVVPGSGNIIISNGTDTRTIAADDPNQVIYSGSKVTINPSANLVPNTTYHVEMASGVITDLSGNAFAGIDDSSTFNFTTVADTFAPQVVWNQPIEGQPFKIDDDITIGFNEEIAAGTGNIIISNGTDTRTIAINDASQVTIAKYFNTGTVNNGFITINPAEDLIPDSTYRIEITSGAITDTSGNAWGGFSDIFSFSTISSNPRLSWSNPLDESTDFQVDSNIELFFDEAVKPGSSGNIVISNGSDIRTIAINDTSQVTFTDYGSVFINPSADLIPGTSYHIKVDSGAITDLAGNAYAGISDETALNFSTISSNPLLYWSYPLDDSTDFQIDRNIELYFNETIKAGSSGNIVISNGSDIRIIAINDASQVTFDGFAGIVIDPSADLIPNTHYNIKIDSVAITDLAGNGYAGITDDTTLNFSTVPSDPLLSSSTPADDSMNFQVDQDIVLNFNETVQAGGSGNIVISNGSDTRIIAAADTSQVSFNGGKVTINPIANLIPNTNYSIRIDSGAITDSIGNAYAGINDDTALNFFAVSSEPQILWTDPWDGTQDFPVDGNIELSFNEAIRAGSSGNIVISNGSDTRIIAIDDTSQVTFSGYNSVIINPSTDLTPDTHYSIKIDNGAITDLAGNAYAGISDNTTLDFSTVTTEPRITWSSPWDGLTDFQADQDIVLYFNQVVKPGAHGNIVISNGFDTRTIAINDVSQVTFDGYRMVTINPLTDLIPDTHYSIKIDSSAITDLDGNAYAGIGDDTTLDFSTITTEPRLSWSDPMDNAAAFQSDHDIKLFFNEMVQAGSSGNIVISNGSDTRTIAIHDSSQVTFNGSKVAVNPTADLIPNTHYSIRIDNGAIIDFAGNAYAGINDNATLNFSTVTSEPRLTGSTPWDNATGFQVDHNVELYFDEQIQAGGNGNIVISNGSDTRTIAINDSSQVVFNGNMVIINPSADLLPFTGYSIQIDSGAITDPAGNAYAGISDNTTLDFFTISSEPRLSWSNPYDEATDFPVDGNIELFFNETVQAGGSGNIVISNGTDTRTIAIDDASQISFYGNNGVTINPSADLIPYTNYSVRIDNGAITDLAGNTYAGISDDTTLNFSTVTTEPRLSWSNPWDGYTDFQADQDISLSFNQSVQAGSSGNIVISNGSDTRIIAVNDASQVAFDGYNGVTINPSADLIPNTHYNIKIDSGAITDWEGNAYAGINDDTTLDFFTISSEPRLSSSNPWDDYTGFQIDQNIELSFNEWVQAGSVGNIIITNGSDIRTIAVNDSSQVTFNGSKVTINPTMDLVPNTGYSILIDSGAITDLAGNAYAGISDDAALNFTTAADDGILLVSPVIVGSPGLISSDIAGFHFPII